MPDKDTIKRLKELAKSPLPPAEDIRAVIDSFAEKFKDLPIEVRMSVWTAISGLHTLELLNEMIMTDPKTGPLVKLRGMTMVETALMLQSAKELATSGIETAFRASLEASRAAEALRRAGKPPL